MSIRCPCQNEKMDGLEKKKLLGWCTFPQLVHIGDIDTRSVYRLILFRIDCLSLTHTRPKSASIQQEQCQPCMTTYIHHKHTMVVVSTSSMSLYYGSLLSTSRPLLGYSTVWRPCPEILFEPFQCTFPYPIIRNVCE